MAINWFASLRDVPWSKVIGMTPSIVESGRKLWDRIANKQAEVSTVRKPEDKSSPSTPEALSAIEIRIISLEKRTAQLGEEAVSSFDVVRSLADQHSQLVHAVDVLLVRTRVLLRVCVLLGLAVVALLVFVLSK